MKKLNLKSKLVYGMVSGLAVLAVLVSTAAFMPTSSVAAAAGTPPAQAQRDQRLEKVYQREQQWLAIQTGHLQKANDVIGKVEQYITAQNAKGRDTASLTAALNIFKLQVAAAQSAHNTAASILGAHAGFDANGHVTDPDLARQTLIDTRQSLRSAHQTLKQAAHDLHAAIKEYREANGQAAQQPTAKPVPTAVPTN